MSPRRSPFAFVMMSYSHEFDHVYVAGIRAACEETGVRCETVREQVFSEEILKRICSQIKTADILIAETTPETTGEKSGYNPNVFYEIGYAHALGKRPILLARSNSKLPFDPQHYPYLFYSDVTNLKSDLLRYIKQHIAASEGIGISAGRKIAIESATVVDTGETIALRGQGTTQVWSKAEHVKLSLRLSIQDHDFQDYSNVCALVRPQTHEDKWYVQWLERATAVSGICEVDAYLGGIGKHSARDGECFDVSIVVTTHSLPDVLPGLRSLPETCILSPVVRFRVRRQFNEQDVQLLQ